MAPFRGVLPQRTNEPGRIRQLILDFFGGGEPGLTASLRGAKRRSNPYLLCCAMDCFASLAMTGRKSLRRNRRRHGQERPRDVPEQLAVDGERDRMGGARQDDELAVAVRQQ